MVSWCSSGRCDIHNPDESVFTYILSSNRAELFSSHASFSDLHVNYSRRTDWISEKNDHGELGIVGLCIDSRKEIPRADIPRHLLRNSDEKVTNVVELAARLAGKFVVFYANKTGIYIIPDATASLPVFYNAQRNAICVSSCDNLVNSQFAYGMSKRALDIRLSSELSQPMPYNMTLYDQIKCLLPNHYMNVLTNDVVRYAPCLSMLAPARRRYEIASIIDDTIGRVDSIIEQYGKYYEITCSLSSGWDSRLVLSLLSRQLPQVECYTFNRVNFVQSPQDRGDLLIPPQVCAVSGKKHRMIDDMIAPDDYIKGVEDMVGPFQSAETVNLAYTYRTVFGDRATINGDIIGSIGKSSLAGSLPDWCATERFFLAKLHNYSDHARLETREYLNAVRASGLHSAAYDLFAVESRHGRWVAQASMIYSACGVTSLNIFNSREMIESWMRISRTQRSHKIIHRSMFGRIAPEMMSIPFNPTDRLGFLKKTAPSFLVATHAKYWLGKLRHDVRQGFCNSVNRS